MENGTHPAYPSRPSFRKKIRRFSPFAGRGNVFFPPVLLGDVNGDKRADLLFGARPGELRIFPGERGPHLFARKPLRIALRLPSDERRIWLADLNRDGKQDVVAHLTPTGREPTGKHRVTILMSR